MRFVLACVVLVACRGGHGGKDRPEVRRSLDKLGKAAKLVYLETTKFPVGKAGPTPTAPCCGQPDDKCPVTQAWERDPVWKALDFAVDEPTYFQYRYESDGTTFQAIAIGNTDCDNDSITYKLEGRAVDGSPQTTLVPPSGTAD